MADKELEVLIKADDQASAKIQKAAAEAATGFDKLAARANIAKDATKAFDEKYGALLKTGKQVGQAMTAAGGAIVGSLALAVKSGADYGEALQTASQQTGIAVEAVAKLQFAAEQSNVAFDTLKAGLFRAGKAAATAAAPPASACEGS